ALLGAILGVAVWVFWLNTMQANALMPKAENFLGRQLHQSKIVNRAMQPGFENWSYRIPTGMKSEMLVEVQAGGSIRKETIGNGEIQIVLPENFHGKRGTLQINGITNLSDFSIGTSVLDAYHIVYQHSETFRQTILIRIPYESYEITRVPGAMQYNESKKKWEQVPYKVDTLNKMLEIRTGSFGIFALVADPEEGFFHPMVKTYYWYPWTMDLSLEHMQQISEGYQNRNNPGDMAIQTGWEAADEWFRLDLSTVRMENNAAYMIPGTDRANKLAGRMGHGLTALQVMADIISGKAGDVGADDYLTLIDVSFTAWELWARSVAMTGVSIINHSLGKGEKTSLEDNELIYEEAYSLYYDPMTQISRKITVKSAAAWHELFYSRMMAQRKNLQKAGGAIEADIRQYLGTFWKDGKGRTQAYGMLTGADAALAGDRGISKDLKETIQGNYREHLHGYLENILYSAAYDAETRFIGDMQNKQMRAFARELNREYILTVQVMGEPVDIGSLSVRVQASQALDYWEGETDEEGQWRMKFTLLGFLRGGMPEQVVLVDKDEIIHTAKWNLEKLTVEYDLIKPDSQEPTEEAPLLAE
ncbi:MAG: hypothetical protein R6W96_00470, partial [Clostridia bacterium]